MARNTTSRASTIALFITFLSLLTLGSPTLTVRGDDSGLSSQTDRKPSPDPSALTTQQSQREIAGLKEIISTRLDAMDKAITLLQTRADKVPSEVDLKTVSLKELMIEKFKSFETQLEAMTTGTQLQFRERDTRVDLAAGTVKTAVDSALQAQKESVDKQNQAFSLAAQKQSDAFTKQIDLLAATLAEMRKGLEDKITSVNKIADDKNGILDGRITRIEAIASGLALAKTTQSESSGLLIAVVGVGLSAIAITTTLVIAFRRPDVHRA